MPSPTGMQIYDPHGHHLYLTGSERAAFRTAAEAAPREVRTSCWTLLYTGCRLSEALALTADRVDFQAAVLTFESRKKRRQGVYRAVPVQAAARCWGPAWPAWSWQATGTQRTLFGVAAVAVGIAWVLLQRVHVEPGPQEGPRG